MGDGAEYSYLRGRLMIDKGPVSKFNEDASWVEAPEKISEVMIITH